MPPLLLHSVLCHTHRFNMPGTVVSNYRPRPAYTGRHRPHLVQVTTRSNPGPQKFPFYGSRVSTRHNVDCSSSLSSVKTQALSFGKLQAVVMWQILPVVRVKRSDWRRRLWWAGAVRGHPGFQAPVAEHAAGSVPESGPLRGGLFHGLSGAPAPPPPLPSSLSSQHVYARGAVADLTSSELQIAKTSTVLRENVDVTGASLNLGS